LLKTLAVAIMAATLSACLSSGGGGSSTPPTPPAGDQTPGNPADGDDDSASPDPGTPADPLAVTTAQGEVIGIELLSMRVFRGIPYAGQPQRFAAPQPPAVRTEPLRLGTSFGSPCAQPGGTFGELNYNEDCLNLNVYAPSAPGNYPVMVWIHGGSLTTGSGGASYEPAQLVEKGVVVVTINYRLGALGFLPHVSLADADGAYGNYGLMDQQEALRWIKNNISGFGGDPSNVTIFGESAGGHSVLSLVASPASSGLFHKAISQSGSYNPGQLSLAAGQAVYGNPLVTATGCAGALDVARCLRDLPAQTIIENQAASYLPVHGAGILPRSIDAAFTANLPNVVPMILGSNQDEGRLFVGIQQLSSPTTEANYLERVEALLISDPNPFERAAIANTYLGRVVEQEVATADSATRYPLALAAIQTDWRFNCSNARQWVQLDQRDVPVWGYWFVDRDAPSIVPADPGFSWGAAHAFEIQYVLANRTTLVRRGATEAQLELAERMATYWTNFAKYGDPNDTDGAAESVSWGPYRESRRIMALDPAAAYTTPASSFGLYHNCGYWDSPL
jgi:para-nitrobenzyl esterase